MKPLWARLALYLVLLASPLIALEFYFGGNWYSLGHGYSLGIFFGILSFCYFQNALILAARLRFLDRLLGHDGVIVIHGQLAMLALACAVLHGFFKSSFGFEWVSHVRAGIAAFALYAAVALVSLLLMAGNLLHRIPLLSRWRLRLLKRPLFDYSHLKLFHNVVSIAAILVTLHVYHAAATQESLMRMRLIVAWAGVALLFYVWHKFIRPLAGVIPGWRVARVEAIAPDVVEIGLTRPGLENTSADGLAMAPGVSCRTAWKPGQFAYLRVLSSVTGLEEHPFTIASPPGGVFPAFVIKRVGNYTGRLANLKPGERVIMDGPYGVFTPAMPERAEGAPLIFIAGGIGITPFLSVLKEWSSSRIQGDVALLWCVRRAEDFLYRDFFESLSAAQPRFRFVPVVTGAPEAGGVALSIGSALESLCPPHQRRQAKVYICGPEGMRLWAMGHLASLGFLRRHLHCEAFS